MDELEFRKRVYANPKEISQEVRNAAAANPVLQKILDETVALDADISELANSIAVPAGLAEKLLAIPETVDTQATSREASKPSSNNLFQYYAIAASLIFALGIGAIVTLGGGPTSTELAFGSEVINHLYHEVREIDAIKNGTDLSTVTMPAVAAVMAEATTQFSDEEFLQSMPVRFAKICVVIPTYHSAHLMVQGTQGAVNIIVIDNSPVTSEYLINDDRFNGIVVPMGNGNLILIGEKDENLDTYKSMFSENVEWVI